MYTHSTRHGVLMQVSANCGGFGAPNAPGEPDMPPGSGGLNALWEPDMPPGFGAPNAPGEPDMPPGFGGLNAPGEPDMSPGFGGLNALWEPDMPPGFGPILLASTRNLNEAFGDRKAFTHSLVHTLFTAHTATQCGILQFAC